MNCFLQSLHFTPPASLAFSIPSSSSPGNVLPRRRNEGKSVHRATVLSRTAREPSRHPYLSHCYPTVTFLLCPLQAQPTLDKTGFLPIHSPYLLHDTLLLLPCRNFPWIRDLIPDRRGFATYTMIHICFGGAVPCSPTPNFQSPPFEQEPIQDRFGLLHTHSAKPSSPPPNSLRNFRSPFDTPTSTASL